MWNSLTDVVDRPVGAAAVVAVAVAEVVVDGVGETQAVDLLAHENHSARRMCATNAEVEDLSLVREGMSLSLCSVDRGHYAYDCEIRLRRQRRMK